MRGRQKFREQASAPAEPTATDADTDRQGLASSYDSPDPSVVPRFWSGWSFRRVYVYAIFLAILLGFSIMLWDEGFLTSSNLLTIGRQAAPIAVMAVGTTFALASAEIDLSIGSLVGLTSLVVANVVSSQGFVAGLLAGLATGVVVGLLNGALTVKLRIPSFLVTLGTLGIVGGLARNVNQLQSVRVGNEAFTRVFGSGSLANVSTLLIWAGTVAVLGWVCVTRLRFGRHLLATGANRLAARAAGINTDRVRMTALLVSSLSAAFAGILIAGRLGVGRHNLGESDLLVVIAAVIIGGTSIYGGRASIAGAIVGALILAMLSNGLILMGLGVGEQQMAQGAILILAVATTMRDRREA